MGREAFEQKLKGQGGQEQSREAGPLHRRVTSVWRDT